MKDKTETTTVIPSQDGYQTVSLMGDAEEAQWIAQWPAGNWGLLLFTQPVVAWCISIIKEEDGSLGYISTVAVTPRLDLSPDTEAVWAPDGRVFDGEDVYDDLNGWAKERFEHQRKLIEVRKAVEAKMGKK